MRRLSLTLVILFTPSLVWAEPEISDTNTASRTIELRLESKSRQCQALASLEYSQRGAEAEVETRIHTDDCGAASGGYVVNITIRGDDDKEPRILRFEESWERSDDSPVETLRRYPIGDDVDLLRLKTRKLSCECADTTEPSAEQ